MADIKNSTPNTNGVISGSNVPKDAKVLANGSNLTGAPKQSAPAANTPQGLKAPAAASTAPGAAKAGLSVTQVVLIALAGTLLAVGGLWTFILTQEENLAAKNANLVLRSFEQSALEPLGLAVSAEGISDFLEPYIAPDQPQYETEQDIERALKTLSNYRAIAKLYIKKLDLTLPILSESSTQALKISVCRFQGPEPLEPGNLVLTGHNYKNGSHFGRLDSLTSGDEIIISNEQGKARRYFVYDMIVVEPDDLDALDPGKNQNVVTLVTCADNGTKRLLVKCRSI